MEKKKSREKVLYVRVSEDIFKEVDAIAEEEGRSQVSVCRQAVMEFLKRRKEK